MPYNAISSDMAKSCVDDLWFSYDLNNINRFVYVHMHDATEFFLLQVCNL